MQTLTAFYDRSLRLWTAYFLDENGNQCSDTGYGSSRTLAVADIAPCK